MELLAKIKTSKLYYFVTNGRSRDPINFKSIIQENFRKAGIWYDYSVNNIHWAVKIYILCFLITNINHVMAVFSAEGDLKALFDCFSVLSFSFMGSLKLLSLLTKQKLWRYLINQASFLENEQLNNRTASKYCYDSDDEEDNSFPEHINKYTKHYSSLTVSLARFYYFTVVVFIATPFIDYELNLYQGKDIKTLPHIFPGWTPLDFNVIGYLTTIAAEVIAAIFCVTVHLSFDLTAVGFMVFIRGQFSLLHNFSTRIGGKGKLCDISNKRDKRAYLRIKKCHQIHVFLLQSVNELCHLIHTILGIYFYLTTLTLCSVAMQFTRKHLSASQLIALIQYMGGIVIQLYLFCHYGDALFNKSSVGPGEGPFCAAIWCLRPKTRREIALLGLGMSKPCKILAGPLNMLYLPSFIQIIRAAYGYYAVFGQITK